MTRVDQDVLIKKLNDIIRRSVPKVETVSKYGGTLYTLKPEEKEGQFRGVFPYKEHVQLAFSNGTALRDPKRVLAGSGKFLRHLKFSIPVDINPEIVSALIKESVEHSQLLHSKRSE